MNAKALIPLIAGLAIAGLAAKLGFDFIRKAEGNQGEMVKLWAPIQDVKRGVAIAESMLEPLAFPAGVVPAGALADMAKIVGRVPHTGAPAGLPILNSMLLPPGVNAGVRVPPGLRAVAVKVDESSGVDNHLEPGCHVDVVGVFTVRRTNRIETLARTILEDVQVAAVGQRLAPTAPSAAEEKSGKSSRRDRPARAVTLLVKPAQVPTLHLAEQKGKIKLSMRGAQDQSRTGKRGNVSEGAVTGIGEPEPELAAEPSWSDKLSGFVNSLTKGEPSEPEPVPEPEPELVVATGPQLEWKMVIVNGDERRVLGWTELDSFQAIELESEGPNIFQDEPRFPPTKPTTGSQTDPEPSKPTQIDPPNKAESEPESGSDWETEADSENNTEPEELFE